MVSISRSTGCRRDCRRRWARGTGSGWTVLRLVTSDLRPGLHSQIPVVRDNGSLLTVADLGWEESGMYLSYDGGHHLQRSQRDHDSLVSAAFRCGGSDGVARTGVGGTRPIAVAGPRVDSGTRMRRPAGVRGRRQRFMSLKAPFPTGALPIRPEPLPPHPLGSADVSMSRNRTRSECSECSEESGDG